MTLRALMQAGPTKANELFTRLIDTTDGAVKTRERVFAELKAELEAHTELEEQYLFPVLRKHGETKELVVAAIKDNKELRAALAELEALPKGDETFLPKLAEMRKAFRQHARDETKELLPAVQKALSEEQVDGITSKMETSVAETERRVEQEATAERERRAVARHTREAAALTTEAVSQTAEAVARTTQAASETVHEIAQSVAGSAQEALAAPRTTGFPFWDMWLGMSAWPLGPISSRGAIAQAGDAGQQVIPLVEEVLTVGTRKVSSGTTRVRRYVVETPVERQVTLVKERVVVERRRPVTDKISGDALTELTIEVIETDEVPVKGKVLRLKEEIVVRTERTERVETVRDTLRQDKVAIERSEAGRPVQHLRARAHA